MSKFCGNCGKEMSDEQRFCPNCGKEFVNNVNENVNGQMYSNNNVNTYQNTNMNTYSYSNAYNGVNRSQVNHNTYKMVVGIIMIILGVCLVSAGAQTYEDNALLTYTFPGILGIIASIITICSRNNHSLLKPAGIVFIVSAGINFLGIYDISIYAILAIVFGVLNIVYCKKQ